MRRSLAAKTVKCSLALTILVATLIDTGQCQSPAVFLCQHSSDQSGLVYIPNIPDFYFSHENAADFSTGPGANLTTPNEQRGTVFIFSIPPKSSERNCSGTVVSLQYCYNTTQIGEKKNYFNFLLLDRTGSSEFTVTNRVRGIATPQQSNCTGNMPGICCSTTTLDMDMQFQITSSTFWFGVTVLTNGARRPLAFANSNTEYRVEQYQERPITGNSGPLQNAMFSVSSLLNRPLLLFRFLIVPDTVPMTTALPTTGTPLSTTLPQTTSPPMTTAEHSTTAQLATTTVPLTTESTTTVQATTFTGVRNASATTEANTETNTAATAHPSTFQTTVGNGSNSSSSRSNGGALVGGIVGGGVAGILLLLLVLVLIVVIARRNKKYDADAEPDENGGMILTNAVYGLNGAPRGSPNNSSDRSTDYHLYAGVGPHAHYNIKNLKGTQGREDESEYAYAYAETGATSRELANRAESYEVPVSLTAEPTRPNIYAVPESDQQEEDIYLVPAMDVDGLYSQLSHIKAVSLPRKSVRLGTHLGSGQFGVVHRGVWLSPNGEVKVAVKTLKEGSGEEDRVKFLQEAAIMGQFKHPNVVTMYGVVMRGEPVLIILDLLSKGDLRNCLSILAVNKATNSHTLLSYCRQVASGMTYLSSKAFVHRDLAARNILVSGDDICKIADFGMSRDLMDESYYVSHGGKIPVKWTAPEALHYKKYSTASDVWSYGALMYEIWSVGHKPFENITNIEALKLLDTGYRLPPPPGCPRAIYIIMMFCWDPQTTNRPSFQNLTRQLSQPEIKLLGWSVEDKSVHPDASQLGADLICGEELYKDLQFMYDSHKSTVF